VNWADFRWEFAPAQREKRIISNTASGTGYHTVKVAENYVHGQLPTDGGFVTDMANLAISTSTDCETVVALAKKIATLTDQLAARDLWAKSKEENIKHLVSGRAITGAADSATPVAAYICKSYKTKNDNYCWSHGYQVGHAHTSANCTKKSPGHKYEATKDNIMGGDTWGSEFL
jgi:hypothetical protein